MQQRISPAEAPTLHKDVYTLISEQAIQMLETGKVPWDISWATAQLPANLITKKPYTGVNVLLLASAGYERNLFVTYKQLTEIGGKVKRDEKGQMVVFWDYTSQGGADTDAGKKKAILKYYTVFNISQCENIPEQYAGMPEPESTQPMLRCGAVAEGMPNAPKVVRKDSKAYYDPRTDTITMPRRNAYASEELYYRDYFHELIHATGHAKRLKRRDLIEMAEFGYEPYTHEELVAEIGSSYLLFHAGVVSNCWRDSTYVKRWILALQQDKRMLLSAATCAQKAVNWILNIQNEDRPQTDE